MDTRAVLEYRRVMVKDQGCTLAMLILLNSSTLSFLGHTDE